MACSWYSKDLVGGTPMFPVSATVLVAYGLFNRKAVVRNRGKPFKKKLKGLYD